MARPLPNLTGQTFGRLKVEFAASPSERGKARWHVKCECGTAKIVTHSNLMLGNASSCGCQEGNKKHGATETRAYVVWAGMLKRCSLTAKGYDRANYYLRGIRVCDEWQDFPAFLASMGQPPEGMTLERKDNEKGYSPENCRWATRREQNRNTRQNVLVNVDGRDMLLVDAVKATGMSQYRLRRYHSTNPPPSYF